MALFKCRDCGYDVDDPVSHICGPPKNPERESDEYSYKYKPPPNVQAKYENDTIPRSPSPNKAEEAPAAGYGFGGFFANLFGGAAAPAEPEPERPASPPPKPNGLSRAREETMYTSSSVGPRATSMTIDLSEIMVYKDFKSVMCNECNYQIRKGDEIVCIENDLIHAKCTVCQLCKLTADRDPYGSDGWKCISGDITCADCIASQGSRPAAPAAKSYNQSSKYQPSPPTSSSKPGASGSTTCATCKQRIRNTSELIKHPKLKGSHHAECLTCQLCAEPLDHTFDANNPVHVRKNQPLCHPCYLKTLPRCGGCMNVITRDTRVCAALGQKFHPQCFCCFKCGKGFPDKSFYVYDNQPYCRRCYHELNGTICATCDQPIEGPCACVVEGRFHPNCFVCTTCRTNLTDVYYSYEKRPYCERHIAEIQRLRGGGRAERRQTYYKNM